MRHFQFTLFLIFIFVCGPQTVVQCMEDSNAIEMQPYQGGQFTDSDYDFLEKGQRKQTGKNHQIVEALLSNEYLERARQIAILDPPSKTWDNVPEDVWYLVAQRLPRGDQYSLRLTNWFFYEVVGRVLFGEQIDLSPEAKFDLPLKGYLAAIYKLSATLDALKEEARVPYHRAICERLKVLAQLRYGLKWADRQDYYRLAEKYHIPVEEDTWSEKLRAYQFWYFYSYTTGLRNIFQGTVLLCALCSVPVQWFLMPARVPDYCKSLYFVPVFSVRNTMATSYGFIDKAILTGITLIPPVATALYHFGNVEQGGESSSNCDICPIPPANKTVAQGVAFIHGRSERAKARSKTRIVIALSVFGVASIANSVYTHMLLTSQYGPFSNRGSLSINGYNQMVMNPNHTLSLDATCCQYRNAHLGPCGPVSPSDYHPDYYDINQFEVLAAQSEYTSHLRTPLILAFWPSVIAFLQFFLVFFKLI